MKGLRRCGAAWRLSLERFCVAYANVLVKARGGRIDSATLTLGQMVFGMIPLLIIGITTERAIHAN